MNNMNFNNFLTTLTEEQRTALTACRTEEELEQVIDDYDIEIPDEMLVGVAGGKGIMPLLMAGIIAFSGAAMTAAPITAAAADHVSVSVTPQVDAKIFGVEILEVAEAKFQQCIADLKAQLQELAGQRADLKELEKNVHSIINDILHEAEYQAIKSDAPDAVKTELRSRAQAYKKTASKTIQNGESQKRWV